MRRMSGGFLATAVACLLLATGCSRHGELAVAAGTHDPGVHIGPAAPDVTSQLEAVVEVSGIDPAACQYAWSRNGEPIPGETRAVLAPAHFRKDDLVAVVVTPPVAGGQSRKLRAEVRIANAPPVVTSTRIAISATATGSVLQAEPDCSDPDGDAVTSAYRWFRNSQSVEGGSAAGLQVASASRGDRFVVEVVASDGVSRSEPRRSTEFVLENRPPGFTSQPATVVQQDGVYRYDVKAVDPDGDAVRFELAQAPSGMTITPGGAIEWKLPTEPRGTKSFHIVIRATDAKGGEASQSIDLSL